MTDERSDAAIRLPKLDVAIDGQMSGLRLRILVVFTQEINAATNASNIA
jgi:hypothetical protein